MQRTHIATIFSPSRRHRAKMLLNLDGSYLTRYTLDGLRVRELDFVVDTLAEAIEVAEESLMISDAEPVLSH